MAVGMDLGQDVYELQYPFDYKIVFGHMMVKTRQHFVILSSWKIRKGEEPDSTFIIYKGLKGTCEMNEM